MRITILGSAAGGGFPQWNCNCRNCAGVRSGTLRAKARTQSSIFVRADTSVDGVLFNASPDILEQIRGGPALQPARRVRDSAITGVVLMDGQVDHATGLFMLYSALNGLTLSAIFVVYTGASLATTFLVCAGMFAAMSIYGFVTKRDLTTMGSLLFMALIGLLIASVVNIFWANSTLYWIITYAGVLIFVGLTAYDTQNLKMIALQTADNPAMAARLAISGALKLYLDFINLFLFLLRTLGDRR